jgi:Ferredoxin-like domain in Api92-like protein
MTHTTNDQMRFASAALWSSQSEKSLTSTNMGSGKTWQSSHLRNRLCERNKEIMPNWCENWLSIRSTGHSVQDYIDGWRAASQDPGLAFSLTSFVPMPGGVWDHDWCVTHWGTKWDADSVEIEILDEHHGLVRFGTAWSPPLPAIEALSRRHPRLELILDFGDPAMDFAGRLAGSGGVLEQGEVPSGSPFAQWYRDIRAGDDDVD